MAREKAQAKRSRKSSTKTVDKKVKTVSDAKYEDDETNYEPDVVTRLSQEHLESLKFKHFKFDPTDSVEDIMKNNPLLDVILGNKKFTPDYQTTKVVSEFPPDDKDERKLSRVAGPRLKNAAVFDYYCKQKTYEKITGPRHAPPTLQPSTSTGTVDLTMDD
ncbi:hypothetical protein CAEBREN_16822 [Caenorhabditis brenneri]|uniref:Uncharacterized protein n=1 Tax=Caenorhabditis brenneri TaxID=135651 RepID=G0MMC0_CAEBE|nr:hypothetical protein CAEBREN_16822 [Caenorhabditis brenneri]